MKTFTAFLFALLFCSNAVADNADRTKGVYDQEKLKRTLLFIEKNWKNATRILMKWHIKPIQPQRWLKAQII